MTYDRESNYSCLQTVWASKASLTQRKGRAGRVSAGRCYRLITRDFFRRFIPDYSVPEILVGLLFKIPRRRLLTPSLYPSPSFSLLPSCLSFPVSSSLPLSSSLPRSPLSHPSLPFSQRTSLEISVLKAKQLGMGEPKEVLSHALQPPNITDIERAILNLKEVNAVSYLVSCVTTCYILCTLIWSPR